MRLNLNTTTERTATAPGHGNYLYIESATGSLLLTVILMNEQRAEYLLETRTQIRFPENIRTLEIENRHTADNEIHLFTGLGEFIPNDDGQKVTLTGQDIAIEVRTNPANPLDVAGPLTDAELRATPVDVAGPLTDAELRADAVPIVQGAATAGGTERHRLLTAATTNATSVKATPGQVYAVNGTNTSAGTLYLKFYDKATAPVVGTDTPLETYALPPGPFSFVFPLGSEFLVGIALAVTGGIADADTTATAVNDVVMQTHFA